MPKKEFLEAGEIVGTHGVRGEMRVQPWADSPAQLAGLKTLYFNEGQKRVKVKCRPHKNLLLVTMEGVSTVEEATLLRGKVLWLHRNDLKLPKGRYFVQDLIGMRVVDADTGETYGTITDVSETGANNVYHMDKQGKEILIPAIPDVIQRIDLDADTITITPLKGLFDDED